ncbi:MAG: glycoside hydrolase family 3 C-terminal domain-containing protein [Elusimicrobia bacterium]|nr:glycoside hydrolase family 3 C-terminal domain-containing protein [Elusimicrobiota bacterium]
MMNHALLAAALLFPAPLFAAGGAAEGTPVYRDPRAPGEARADDLLGRMTLDEKITLLSGIDSLDLPPNARLGIPKLRMTDGPLGVRHGNKATAFPAAAASASSFDTELVGELAAAMGVETLALGRDMLLAPCINIVRAPHDGRNMETFGEDPHLAARMAVAYVVGLQSQGVLASTKHYALNNQETERMTIDVRAGERAMHEIYLPAFLAAVRAGTWTIMAAYNKINGHYAAENSYLIEDVLKNRWGFTGWVVSDWGATHSTLESANNGLDVEMPSGEFFGDGKLQAAVHEGKLSIDKIDDKMRRVLRTMFASGFFDRKAADRPPRTAVNSPEHRALALRAAQEGIVLLKNDGVLPLEKVASLAVLGPNAQEYRAGGGSSQVEPIQTIAPLAGLRERAGDKVSIAFEPGVSLPGGVKTIQSEWLLPPPGKGGAHGLWAEYFSNKELQGAPVLARLESDVNHDWSDGQKPAEGVGPYDFSARWTGRLRVPKSGEYELAARTDDGGRLWLDGKPLADDWSDHGPVTHSKKVTLKAGRDYAIKLEFYQHGGGATAQLGWIPQTAAQMGKAVAAAKKADAAVIFVGLSDALEGEGNDRASLSLPEGQDALIEAVAKVNKRVIIVIEAGGPMLMPWADKVSAIVQAWYPGEEGGRAIADMLLGRVNPSGKLPVTFPKRWEDSPAYGHYPGHESVDYAEGLYVGYRHFDKRAVVPLFPFGHGLSYTRFDYANLAADVKDGSTGAPDIEVTADITNSGKRAGAEIAQLYVSQDAPPVDRPAQELKGFARVTLAPGETRKVSFRLNKDAFAYYDEKTHDWVVAPGRFTLRLGASSRDIRLTKAIELK